MTYCTATHPMIPNKSGHARGRKLHCTENLQTTICNMQVDQILEKDSIEYSHFKNNGQCKNCFKQ